MRVHIPLLSLLALGCAAHAPTPAREPQAPTAQACSAPPVALRFAWPSELRAAVTGHDLTESANADGSAPMRGDSWSDLRLEAEAESTGVRVQFLTEGRSRTRSQGFAPDIEGARPTIHLGANGRVAAAEGGVAMRERVQRALQQGELSREGASMLLPNTTDERQRGTAAAHWDWALAAWNGRTMRCGEITRMAATVPALAFGDAMLDTETELEYVGRTPCTRGGERSCVTLEARQRDVGGAAARALEELARGEGVTVASAWFVRTVRVVAEPDTLVLHQVDFEERWEIGWELPEGRTTRLVRDLQSYSFDYERPLPPPRTHWVVTREGGPAQRPDTPACRRVDACCAALGGVLIAQLVCAGIPREGATDCTDDDLTALRGMGSTLPGGEPAECSSVP